MSTGKALAARFGAALQRQRLLRKLTQSQLAKRAKLTRAYVNEIERGQANVSIDDLDRLAQALDWELLQPEIPKDLSDGLWTLLLLELQHLAQVTQHAMGRLHVRNTSDSGTGSNYVATTRPRRKRRQSPPTVH
jgi:transcriptional regulator with XRE-family HTH domain